MAVSPGRRRGQWLKWWLFGVALVGLGAAVHVVLPAALRWSISGMDWRGAISPDGKTLVTLRLLQHSRFGPLDVWDTASGRRRCSLFRGVEAPLDGLVNSRDLRHFAVVLDYAKIAMADAVTGREWTISLPIQRPLHAATGDPPRSACYPPRGKYFVFREGAADSRGPIRIHLLEACTGNVLVSFLVDPIYFEFTPEEDRFLFFEQTKDGPVFTVWSTQERRVLRRIPVIKRGECILAPNGRTLLTSGAGLVADPLHEENSVVLWDLGTGTWKELTPHPSRGWGTFAPDSQSLARLEAKGARVFDVASGRERAFIKLPVAVGVNCDDVSTLDFSPDGRLILLTSSIPENVSLWDTEGRQLWEKTAGPSLEFVAAPHLAVERLFGRFRLMDAITGKLHASVVLHEGQWAWPTTTVFAGNYVVAACEIDADQERGFIRTWLDGWWPFRRPGTDTVVVVVDYDTGNELARWNGKSLKPVHLSTDGTWLIMESTINGLTTYERWDVPGRPRWGWVAGVPGALAALFLLVRAWHMRRRTRRAATMVGQ